MAVVYRFSTFWHYVASSGSCWVCGIHCLAVSQTVLLPVIQAPKPLSTGTRP